MSFELSYADQVAGTIARACTPAQAGMLLLQSCACLAEESTSLLLLTERGLRTCELRRSINRCLMRREETKCQTVEVG